MIRYLLRAGGALAALALTLAAATAASASPPPRLAPPKSYYLALGDSIAYGFQTSKALAGLPPDAFNTGYADLFAAQLRQLRPRIATVNYSCPGESTTSFRQPCIWKTSGHALHNDYPGSQLDAALVFLAAHRGQVSPITLSLNGNDINEFLQTCPPGDLACIQAGAPAAIAAYQARLTSILRLLRACRAPCRDRRGRCLRSQPRRVRFRGPAVHPAEPGPAGGRRQRCGPGSPIPSRSSTRKATLRPKPRPFARSPCCAPKVTATPPTAAIAHWPASSGPHQATRACGDQARRPAVRGAGRAGRRP